MQRLSILSVCVLTVLATACEKHPASELPREHGAGEPHAAVPTAPADAPKPAEAEVKPGEAPKFFPDSKPESK